jgi:predicted PurR-regulated permease PerM
MLAYLLYPAYQWFYKLLKKMINTTNKKLDGLFSTVALILMLVSVGLLITALAFFVVPELVQSAEVIGIRLPGFIEQIEMTFESLSRSYAWAELLKSFSWADILNEVTGFIQNLVMAFFANLSGITSGIYRFTITLIFALYLIIDPKDVIKPFVWLHENALPVQAKNEITSTLTIAKDVMSRYIRGTLLDALLVGGLFFVSLSLMGIPSAMLVAFLQMVTNLIPVFGAWIGAILSGILIAVVEPSALLPFIILVMVIQQIDANLLQPKIVGQSVGLPGVYVFIAVTIGSQLFGFWGLLLSVPVSAIVFALIHKHFAHEFVE